MNPKLVVMAMVTALAALLAERAVAQVDQRNEYLVYVGPPNPKLYLSFKKLNAVRPEGEQPRPGEKFFIVYEAPGVIALETADGYRTPKTHWSDNQTKGKFERRRTADDPQMMAARDKLIATDQAALEQMQSRARLAEQARQDAMNQSAAAAAAARSAIVRREADFRARNGNATGVPGPALLANPFQFEGRNVSVYAVFHTMISRNQAIFRVGGSYIAVSNFPSTQFSGTAFTLLAGRVLGRTNIQLPVLGMTSVPHLSYIGVHVCPDAQCSDVIAR